MPHNPKNGGLEGNKVSSEGMILGFPDVWRFARGPHPPPQLIVLSQVTF